MKIDHLALWCRDIEALRTFYQHWFGARCGARYDNPAKRFSSYFLSFDEGARLEIMQRHDISAVAPDVQLGYAHLALSLGNDAAVDTLTARLRDAGIPVLDGPRRTGDGYYESVIADPEGNRIELSA